MRDKRHEWVQATKLCSLMSLFFLFGALITGWTNQWSWFPFLFLGILVWILLFFVAFFQVVRYDKKHRYEEM